MKNQAFVFIISILVVSCKKEEIWPFGDLWKGAQTFGYVQAQRNGEIWDASASLTKWETKPDFFEVGFLAYFKSDSTLAESMSLQNIPIAKGSYNVYRTIGLGGTWIDSLGAIYVLRYDDVPRATYFPDNDRNSRLWVDEIDTISGTISGRFDLFFKKDTADKVTKYPSHIHFENGVFQARF